LPGKPEKAEIVGISMKKSPPKSPRNVHGPFRRFGCRKSASQQGPSCLINNLELITPKRPLELLGVTP
jgi:hypothetical protein